VRARQSLAVGSVAYHPGMAKLRKAAGGVTAVAVPVVPLLLSVSGVIPHMRADAVTAWATWITAAIAFGAAVVGLNQLTEVRLTRQEQAQPNVVYSEPNAYVPQILDTRKRILTLSPAARLAGARPRRLGHRRLRLQTTSLLETSLLRRLLRQ
jgi:hypothetical protein